MARVTTEDCNMDNGFALALLAALRAQQLLKGAKPTVEHGRDKATVVALKEIAAGHVYIEGDLEDLLRDPGFNTDF